MRLTTQDGTAWPRLGLGTWRLGEAPHRRADDIDAVALALRLGYRMIDTAEMYGDGGAEQVVGQALRRAAAEGISREAVFVVSKVYPHHATGNALVGACVGSLRRLGLEQLDLYLLHWRGSIPLQSTVDGMQALVRRGLIRRWGVSNFDVDDMVELLACSGGEACAADQVYYSLGQRGAEYALLPWLQQRGMAAMAYSPVDQGTLADNQPLADLARRFGFSAAQLALAWAMRRPGVVAIPKSARETHLRENLASAAIELSESLLVELDRLFAVPARKTPLAMT